eukprot:1369935-Amorphochlora_amoeboformis.AAC.1
MIHVICVRAILKIQQIPEYEDTKHASEHNREKEAPCHDAVPQNPPFLLNNSLLLPRVRLGFCPLSLLIFFRSLSGGVDRFHAGARNVRIARVGARGVGVDSKREMVAAAPTNLVAELIPEVIPEGHDLQLPLKTGDLDS